MDISKDITDCILGAKGSGKSVLLAIMANDLQNRKVILFDMLGVFNPQAGNKTALIPDSYYCMTPDDFLKTKEKYPTNAKIVINFSDYFGEDLIEAIDAVCEHLMAKMESVAVLTDEVADFMPQQGLTSYQFWRLVKNGRNFGIRPVVFASQRPQDVNKKIFDLCDKFIISKQRAKVTVDYILKLLNMDGDKASRAKILRIQPRHFLIFDGTSYKIEKVRNYEYAFKQ